jgi:hypothetical protein
MQLRKTAQWPGRLVCAVSWQASDTAVPPGRLGRLSGSGQSRTRQLQIAPAGPARVGPGVNGWGESDTIASAESPAVSPIAPRRTSAFRSRPVNFKAPARRQELWSASSGHPTSKRERQTKYVPHFMKRCNSYSAWTVKIQICARHIWHFRPGKYPSQLEGIFPPPGWMEQRAWKKGPGVQNGPRAQGKTLATSYGSPGQPRHHRVEPGKTAEWRRDRGTWRVPFGTRACPPAVLVIK